MNETERNEFEKANEVMGDIERALGSVHDLLSTMQLVEEFFLDAEPDNTRQWYSTIQSTMRSIYDDGIASEQKAWNVKLKLQSLIDGEND